MKELSNIVNIVDSIYIRDVGIKINYIYDVYSYNLLIIDILIVNN